MVVVVAAVVVADSDVVEVESVAIVAFLPFWNLGIKGLCQVCDYLCDSPSLN